MHEEDNPIWKPSKEMSYVRFKWIVLTNQRSYSGSEYYKCLRCGGMVDVGAASFMMSDKEFKSYVKKTLRKIFKSHDRCKRKVAG